MEFTIKKYNYLVFALFAVIFCNAQLSVPFKKRFQGNVNGDMTVIANTIMEPVDIKKPKKIVSDKARLEKLNDEFYMRYVDVDNDSTTFSSSTADFDLEKKEDKKIVYAGLYWSATYKYQKGSKKKDNTFTIDDNSREAFQNIKIKLPGQEEYVNVAGEILFDGLKERKFSDNAPYAVYADVTNEILKLKNPFGSYTVANIKATEGTLSGGVAAGWTLFIVYEDLNMTKKFITSYDGFAGVTGRYINIPFSGFNAAEKGKVSAKLAVAALEGDNNLAGDQLFFKTPQIKRPVSLSTSLRKQENFFNGSITVNNDNFINRSPNNINTMGYDTALFAIQNPVNSIIGNNTSDATLKLRSNGDRFFLFFTAFSVEVSNEIKQKTTIIETVKQEIASEEDTELMEDVEPKNDICIDNQAPKFVEESNDVAEVQEKSTPVIPKRENTVSNYNIKGSDSDYYIIVNVFAKESNKTNFIKVLKNKGFKAGYFYNPTKKYYYVYIEKSENKEEVENLHRSKINNTYTEDMWVLAVNKPALEKGKQEVAKKSQAKSKRTNTIATTESKKEFFKRNKLGLESFRSKNSC